MPRSTGQEALSDPKLAFQPKWEILHYRGGHVRQLEVDGRLGFVIQPTGKTDKQRRWIWIAPSWLAIGRWDVRLQKIVESPEVDYLFYVEGVLAEGFHVAGVDVGTSCGNPAGVEVFQDFYEDLVHHESPRSDGRAKQRRADSLQLCRRAPRVRGSDPRDLSGD